MENLASITNMLGFSSLSLLTQSSTLDVFGQVIELWDVYKYKVE